MKRTWPIIAVSDVQVSSKWYQTLLNAANNHPGDLIFAQVLDEDGTILLCLHRWGRSRSSFADEPAQWNTRQRSASIFLRERL